MACDPLRTAQISIKDVPRETFHRIISEHHDKFYRTSADEYHESAARFAEAVERGESPFAVSFDRGKHLASAQSLRPVAHHRAAAPLGKQVSAEVLHDLGCIMMYAPSMPHGSINILALWASASEMGHDPSTISLARTLVLNDLYMRLRKLARVEARFQKLVAQGRDPNALTVEGQWLYKQGRFEAAAVVFQRALKLGSPGFQWKWACWLWLGRAFLKLGEAQGAREALEPLAELGLADASKELAGLLRKTDPDRAQQHIYNAACNGLPDMFAHLSEMALEEAKAAQATDRRLSDESHRWAVEWSRLANWRADS